MEVPPCHDTRDNDEDMSRDHDEDINLEHLASEDYRPSNRQSIDSIYETFGSPPNVPPPAPYRSQPAGDGKNAMNVLPPSRRCTNLDDVMQKFNELMGEMDADPALAGARYAPVVSTKSSDDYDKANSGACLSVPNSMDKNALNRSNAIDAMLDALDTMRREAMDPQEKERLAAEIQSLRMGKEKHVDLEDELVTLRQGRWSQVGDSAGDASSKDNHRYMVYESIESVDTIEGDERNGLDTDVLKRISEMDDEYGHIKDARESLSTVSDIIGSKLDPQVLIDSEYRYTDRYLDDVPRSHLGDNRHTVVASTPILSTAYDIAKAKLQAKVRGELEIREKKAKEESTVDKTDLHFSKELIRGQVPAELMDSCSSDIQPAAQPSAHPREQYIDTGVMVDKEETFMHSNESLLQALCDERILKQRAEEALATLHDELNEARLQFEVDVESQKVEILKLKSQVRALVSDRNLDDVFYRFEDDVSRLTKENESLRYRNIRLESRDIGLNLSVSTIQSTSPRKQDLASETGVDLQQTMKTFDSRHKKLISRLQKVLLENEQLVREKEDIAKKDRVYHATARVNDDLRKKVTAIQTENADLRCIFESTLHQLNETESDMLLVKEELRELQLSEQALREERAGYHADLLALQERVCELQKDNTRGNQMRRFLSKHMPGGEKALEAMGSQSPIKQNHSANIKASVSKNGVNAVGNKWAEMNESRRDVIDLEDMRVVSDDLEKVLSFMHEQIIENCPKLLPKYRDLTAAIHRERAKMLQQRAKLIDMLYPSSSAKGESKVSSGNTFASSLRGNTGSTQSGGGNAKSAKPKIRVETAKSALKTSSNGSMQRTSTSSYRSPPPGVPAISLSMLSSDSPVTSFHPGYERGTNSSHTPTYTTQGAHRPSAQKHVGTGLSTVKYSQGISFNF